MLQLLILSRQIHQSQSLLTNHDPCDSIWPYICARNFDLKLEQVKFQGIDLKKTQGSISNKVRKMMNSALSFNHH